MLRKLLEDRRASEETQLDMLGCLMNKDENKYKLTDDEIIDQIITILYSGYETVSTTSMMAVKYLHDHPKVLEELRVSLKDSFVILKMFNVLCFYEWSWLISLNYFCRKNIWQLEKREGQRIQLNGMILNQ